MLAYFGLFFSAFSSATLLPGSSEVVLSALAINNRETLFQLWLVATMGNVLGSCVNYWLGLKMMSYQHTSWFPISPQQVMKAQQLFGRYGVWSLLLSWVPIIGDPLTLVAGLCKFRFWLFLLLVSISKGARYAFIILGIMGIERLI
ncbi:DedA family protein [Pseudoalteromonas citrea]|uniref:DedA family protein n=1 Tax=Pseudoalteromonas citrea TaxID=43655 RepID=A0A5S3XKG8_9GAMM|nr:DedA family protein [Pseudoalteromonas citrea]TMP55318.1 DedA family protein [Pseudoalteromonas citrea]